MTSPSVAPATERLLCPDCRERSVIELARTPDLIHLSCENTSCDRGTWTIAAAAVITLAGAIRGSVAEDGFRPFQPLPPAELKVPDLNPDLLCPPLRAWIEDIADRLQVALELVAVPALVGIAAVIGRRIAIHPKAQDDWLVVPNLWGGIVARPGMLKSPTLAEALRPIHRLEEQARQHHQERLPGLQSKLDALKAKEQALKNLMRKSYEGKKGTVEEHEEALTEVRRDLQQLEQQMRAPRYVVNDTTVEKLGELFREHPNGLLLERDELAGWLRSLEREDRKGDRELFLESWNGTNPYTYDRIGRGTKHIPALCLSIVGGIQPAKLRRYVTDAVQGGYAADGLLQRFQLLVHPEERTEWRPVDRRPDQKAAEAVFDVVAAIARLGCSAPGGMVKLRFAADAQEPFNDWWSKLEIRLRSAEFRDTPAFESHLAKYRSLMPSLALLFHVIDQSRHPGGPLGPVSFEAACMAADWCDYLELHARKIYAVELNAGLVAAHALATKLRAGQIPDGATIREIYRSGWSLLKTPEAAWEAVELLGAHGWVRVETSEGPGRPSHSLRINPQLTE